ncbi:MAG TPA: Glu/Leu/Phe/Val dehydrogenase dimerization domain-containing protein [Acidimicrobiia bacterium]|nr:Glu/Leu/Phe/Val dehydrogenase dimerization domain-containing protein [Acidimicrobiia bacterium]
MPVRTRTVTELMSAAGHEQVVFVAQHDVGLRAIIAIHSTALGPSLGGVRFWSYPNERAALADALALSEAMTLKASIAGLDQGGGKTVVFWDDPERPRSIELLHALGRAIDDLGGRYLAAEDVGATTADMDGLAEVTPWVTGVDEAAGGSGDPSPVTAWGVLHAMHAACAHLDGEREMRGRRVVVQGAGHVGAHLARLLVDAGAVVVVSDLFPSRASALASDLGVASVAADEALVTPCDILSPNALGGVLDAETIASLRCRAVVGAANNQLGGVGADRLLAERDVLFVPDFVASGGGIINLAQEFTGYDRAQALDRAARIEATTARVLAEAEAQGVTPQVAALELARARVHAAGDHRWQPGDPAAWTDGAPLTRLRPNP